MEKYLTMYAEPCTCPPEYCAHFVEPPSDCISRLEGEVVTKNCKICNPIIAGVTWHHKGECLRCLHLAKDISNGNINN